MNNVSITNSLISRLKPKAKEYDVRDTRLKGFMIRVHPTGKMSYIVQYARSRRTKLGEVGVITPAEARERAVKILADYANGITPQQAKREKQQVPTLKAYLDKDYAAWVKTHNISGDEAIKTIERHFSHLLDKPIDQIKVQDIEKWRTRKLESKAMQANTINRTITPLRSALAKRWNGG